MHVAATRNNDYAPPRSPVTETSEKRCDGLPAVDDDASSLSPVDGGSPLIFRRSLDEELVARTLL
jgi:hypothetical protein